MFGKGEQLFDMTLLLLSGLFTLNGIITEEFRFFRQKYISTELVNQPIVGNIHGNDVKFKPIVTDLFRENTVTFTGDENRGGNLEYHQGN